MGYDLPAAIGAKIAMPKATKYLFLWATAACK